MNRSWTRGMFQWLAMLGLAMFIAAPTPGNVGGCSSGTGGSALVTAGDAGVASETAEYEYFDHGLCSYFCWRLFECGVLCNVVEGADPAACGDASNPQAQTRAQIQAYTQCVRGRYNAFGQGYFGFAQCPHQCPSDTPNFRTAHEWNVQACGAAVLARNCNAAGPGAIGALFDDVPTECLNLCQ